MQSLLRALYPAQCMACSAVVDSENSLCGACWRDTPFITGLVCDSCGVPLPGEATSARELCDDCLTIARPWARGRAALLYEQNARRLVLALKHGDRTELAPGAASWMCRAGADALAEATLVAPIPLHWSRMIKRRFNQASELAHWVAKQSGLPHMPDLLQRTRWTNSQDGRNREARFENMAKAITVHPRRLHHAEGARICLIDDVMTSGATFASASEACLAAGAKAVTVLTLARVHKTP